MIWIHVLCLTKTLQPYKYDVKHFGGVFVTFCMVRNKWANEVYDYANYIRSHWYTIELGYGLWQKYYASQKFQAIKLTA